MLPVFQRESFRFTDDEREPDHIEDLPSTVAKDRNRFHLEGRDTFSGDSYELARNIGDLSTAQLLEAARQRLLDETQTPEMSGGQRGGGVQDTITIVVPENW